MPSLTLEPSGTSGLAVSQHSCHGGWLRPLQQGAVQSWPWNGRPRAGVRMLSGLSHRSLGGGTGSGQALTGKAFSGHAPQMIGSPSLPHGACPSSSRGSLVHLPGSEGRPVLYFFSGRAMVFLSLISGAFHFRSFYRLAERLGEGISQCHHLLIATRSLGERTTHGSGDISIVISDRLNITRD